MASQSSCGLISGLIKIQLPPGFPSFKFSESDLVADITVDNSWQIPTQLPTQLKDYLALSTNSISIGDSSARDHLLWHGNPSCNISIREAWNLLRIRATETFWSMLIWNIFINPRLACLSWRLMHRKTPSGCRAKQRGWSLASRCYNCFSGEESELHIFFSCILANQLWNWILTPYGVQSSRHLSSPTIWDTLSKGKDVLGRKSPATIFFHAIFVLWFLWNDSKHNSRKPSLERAKLIFMDHLRGMASAGLKSDQGSSSCKFFKWCDTVTINGVPDVVESPYPTCECGAGKCILLTEKDGKDAGRKYLACPIKKGQGACNFHSWHDLLGKGTEGAVARELKFSDTNTLSHHGERRASLSSGPSNREILDVVAYGGHVGEQPESVGQGARSCLQHLDGPGKDFQRDGVTRAIIFSDTGAQSQYGEQRKSFSPGPFEGEIIDGEASGDHIAVQSDSEVSDQSLLQFCEQIESRYSLLSGEPSEGEVLDTDASGSLISVQSGSEGGNSFAGPEGDEGYMSDILLSTARHFANEFLKHIQGLCIRSFLRQRNQLVEAIRWVTSFGVDCSFFVSQIDDLIQLIDDFQALSCLAKKEEAIDQFKKQLSSIYSEDACRQARLNTIEGELRIMAQAKGELVAEWAEVFQDFNTVTEELHRLASERQLLLVEADLLEEAAAKSQQIKAELQEKIEQTGQEKAEIIAALQTGYNSEEQLLEQLGIYLWSLQMWD